MDTINARARDQVMKSQATENDPPNRLEKALSLIALTKIPFPLGCQKWNSKATET